MPAPAQAQNSPATGAPAIAGFAQVGNTLTAGSGTIADADGLPGAFPGDYTFQWVRVAGGSETDISGAFSPTYTVAAADLGATVKVEVSFTDGAGNAETLASDATAAVVAAPAACDADAAWCAVLTVGENKRPRGYCGPGTGVALCSYGALDDDDFTLYGVAYTVESLRWGHFELSDSLHLTLDRDFPDALLSGLRLEVGGHEFDLSDADRSNTNLNVDNNYFWSGPAEIRDYAVGRAVRVELFADAPPTGSPLVSGTARVGETLSASTAFIRDPDGLIGASYAYQWLREDEDGSNQADISGATSVTYELAEDDAGKRVRVKVDFTDDAMNAETLTSAAFPMSGTIVMAAPPMTDPTDLLSATLTVQDMTGILGCDNDDSGDECSDSSILTDDDFTLPGTSTSRSLEEISLSIAQLRVELDGALTDEQIERLVIAFDSTEFRFSDAVAGANNRFRWNRGSLSWSAGDDVAVTIKDAPPDNTPPSLTSANVDATGGTVALGFGENLDAANLPPASAFTVTVDGSPVTATFDSVSDATYTLTLLPYVQQGQAVAVSYTDPSSGDDANALQDADGNDVATFENVAVTNGSTFVNTPAAGAPTVSGSGRAGQMLSASTSGISDADGLTSPSYTYQWFRLDGAAETAIAGATSSSYMPVAADVGRRIGVRVSFADDKGTPESVASAAVTIRAAMAPATCPAPSLPAGRAEAWSTTLTVGRTLADDRVNFAYGWFGGSDGSLSDTDFVFGTTTYTISAVNVGAARAGELLVSLESALTAAQAANLRLHVCGEAYALSEAEYEEMGAHIYRWPTAGLDWSALEGMTRELRLSLPTITIAADRPKAIGGHDYVYYTLTRSGPTAAPLTVPMQLVPPAGNDWNLSEGDRNYEVTFAGGAATAEQVILLTTGTPSISAALSQDADFDGPLTARLGDVDGYDTADTAVVEVVMVPVPRWFGRLVDPAPRFAEGGGAQAVEIEVYAADPAMPAPSLRDNGKATMRVGLFLDPGTATHGTDYVVITLDDAGTAHFPTSAFSVGEGGVQRGRATIDFTPVQDSLVEGDETLNLQLNRDFVVPFQSIEFDLPGGGRDTTGIYPAVIVDDDAGVLSVAVTSTPGASADTYGVGDEIRFTVTFSTPVTVTGEPHFEFSLNGVDTEAALQSGSGTKQLVFAYTVEADDEDTDGIWVGDQSRTIKLDPGEHIQYQGADAVRDHAALGTQSGHKVDGSLSPTGRPSAPADLVAAVDDTNAIVLTWKAPSSMGGSAITGYTVEWSADGSAPWTAFTGTIAAGTLTYTDTSVGSDTERHYRVAATNTQGTGTASATASARTLAGVPGAPTGLTATKNAANPGTAIDLAWTAPADEGDSDVTGYRIEWSADGNAPWAELVADTGNTDTAYSDEDLPSPTTRHYRVSARNTQGLGGRSNVASATTDDVAGPVLVSATVSEDGSTITLVFDEPVDLGDDGRPRTNAFTLTVDGVPAEINGIEVRNTHPRQYVLDAISPSIRQGQAVVVTYTDPTANDDPRAVQDALGNDAASFTTGAGDVPAVVNNSLPTITIAADRPKAIGGHDYVYYTLTRSGPTAAPLTVPMQLVPPAGNDWNLSEGDRNYEVTFAGGAATAEQVILLTTGTPSISAALSQDADFDGPLTARLGDVDGYDTADTAVVEVVMVPVPRWFGRLVDPAPRFAEGGGAQAVEIEVYAADPAMPAPSLRDNGKATMRVGLFLDPGTATHGTDYVVITLDDAGTAHFPTSAFSVGEGGVQRGRATIDFTPVQDSLVEGDETLNLQLNRDFVVPFQSIEFDLPGGGRDTTGIYPAVIVDDDAGVLSVAVTSTPGASADTYGVGDEIRFTVTFSTPVTVTGEPHFEFSLNGVDTEAALQSGSGTKQLVFAYTVEADDEDTDGIWVGDQSRTIKLDPGEHIQYQGADAVRDHAALGTQSGHKVDGSLSPTGRPSAPADLVATVDDTNAIVLTWKAPSSMGGSAITGYTVEWSADGSAPWTAFTGTIAADTLTYTDTSVGSGTERHYRVSATNTQGTGTASATASARTDDVAGPVLVSATVSEDGSTITLVFDEPVDLGDGRPRTNAFTLTVDGVPAEINGIEVRYTRLRQYVLDAISPSIKHGQAVVVTYTDPTANDDPRAVQDALGNDAASFTTGAGDVPAVVNNSLPTITIAADRPKAIGGHDYVYYTLTRSGPTAAPLTVPMQLVPPAGNDWNLSEGDRNYEVTFAGGAATAEQVILLTTGTPSISAALSQDADFDGPLTARLGDVDGYDTADTAVVEVVMVPVPRWFGRLVDPAPRFAEGGGAQAVEIEVYAADPAMPAPSLRDNGKATMRVGLFLDPGTATHGTDYVVITLDDAGTAHFPTSAFSVGEGGVQRGRATIDFTPVQDSLVEGDETLNLQLNRDFVVPFQSIEFDLPGGGRDTTGIYPAVIVDDDAGVLSVAVTSTPGASADTYGVGDEIRFTVTFSTPVTVTGEPHFEFSLNGVDTEAALQSGSGTKQLVFAYTVEADDEDTDGIWVGDQSRTIKLDPGEHIQYQGADAVRDHAALGTQSGHKVDGSLSPTGRPSAPADLVAAVDDTNAIVLTWKAPSSMGGSAITGYTVEWSADGSAPWTAFTGTIAAGTLTYTDTSVGSDTERHYRVAATNTQGTGTASATASARTNDVAGPVLVSATVPAAGESIVLVFDEPVDLGDDGRPRTNAFTLTVDGVPAEINGIEVRNTHPRQYVLDAISPSIRQDQAVVVTYTDPTANDDPRAVQDALGNDAASFTTGADDVPAVVNRSNVTPVAPGKVPNLDAEAGTDGMSIVLTWEAPADNGGRVVASYRIEVSDDGGVTFAAAVETHNETDANGAIVLRYAHTVPPGETRHYRVAARNSAGLGDWSDTAQGRAVHPGAPSPPRNVTAQGVARSDLPGPTQVSVSWEAPEDRGDSDRTGYRLEYSEDVDPLVWELWTNRPPNDHVESQTGLPSETTRHYRVFAINDQGRSLPSDVASVTTPDVAGPAPESASVPAAGDSIAIAFDEALDETTANLPQAARFAVTAADGAVFTVGSVAVDGVTVTLTLASDSPTVRTGQALTVVYTDRTSNDDEAGVVQDDDGNDAADFTLAPGETVSVTNGSTQAVGPPGVPANVRAESGGEDRIVVTWDAPAETGGREITGYRVEVSTDNATFMVLEANHDTMNSEGRFEYVHTGLEVGDLRWYRISARNGSTDADIGTPSVAEQGVVDRKGDVVLSVASASVAESGEVAWTVTATADAGETPASDLSMQVRVTSADGTALAPDDYAAPDATVTFVHGDFAQETVDGDLRWVARKTGTVALVDDVAVERGEAFALSMAIGSGGAGWLAGTDEVEVAIEDDDEWSLAVEADPASVAEGETRTVGLTARIVRGDGSAPPVNACVAPFPVSVRLDVAGTATGAGTDYELTGTTEAREIEACEAQTSWRVEIAARVDAVDDAGETVVFTPALETAPAIEPVSLEAATVTLAEEPGVVLGAPALAVDEGSVGTYTVVLTASPTGTVTVRPMVSGDVDVTVAPTTLTFTPQNWALPQTVTVRAAEDEDDEDDEATVRHAVAGADYAGVTAGEVRIGVRDDDRSFGVLRAVLTEGSDEATKRRGPAPPRVHYGEKFRIALWWEGAVRTGPWDDPWKAIGAERAIRVTGGAATRPVRPVHTPGFRGWTQHVLFLELTPASAGEDVVLTLEPMDCSYPDWKRPSPDPHALCGWANTGRGQGAGPITGLAERVRWEVRGIDGVPEAPGNLLLETEDRVELRGGDPVVVGRDLFARYDVEQGVTHWRIEAQGPGGDWSDPRVWRGERGEQGAWQRTRLDGLEADAAWEVRVRWENRYGAGPWAEAATSAGPPLGAPQGVTLSEGAQGQSVRLAWSPPSGQVARHQYRLARGDDSGRWLDIPDSGPGQANARSFTLEGVARVWEIEARLRAVDLKGRAGEASAAARVPAAAPAVLPGLVRVTSDPGDDGWYGIGDEVEVSVKMSRPVRVATQGVTPGATPTVTLEIGGARRRVALDRIEGAAGVHAESGDTLVFRFEVQAGDEDTDGIAIPARGLALNDARLLDASAGGDGAAGTFRLARAVDAPGHRVQGVVPQVEKIERLGNKVWVHFTRALKPWTLLPELRNTRLGRQFRPGFSVSQPKVKPVADARIVRGRGWSNNCGATADDCRVVLLTLDKVRRLPPGGSTPLFYGAPLPDETVRIGYGQEPGKPIRWLRDVAGNEVENFAPMEAVLLAAGDAPVISVDDAEGLEPRGRERDRFHTIRFQVRLTPAASGEVTVDFRTVDGRVEDDRVLPPSHLSAEAGHDYEQASGTLTFEPGETVKAAKVEILDDTVQDSGEEFALELFNPTGAVLGDSVARGLIHNDERLTAAFHDLPESHDGASAFTFGLEFTETVTASAESLRDDALSVTGGTVTAVAAGTPAGRRFEVTVEPSGSGEVTVRLGPTTDCAASGAVCTADLLSLRGTIEAVVSGPPAAPAVSGAPQVGATLTASVPGAPDGTLAWQWWLRDGEAIAGATGGSYVPVAADLGARLSVRVSRGAATAESAATAPVWPAAGNPPRGEGEAELLSAVLTVGTHVPTGPGGRMTGFGTMGGVAFGALDPASFEFGGATYRIERLAVGQDCGFVLGTDVRVPEPAGLVVYWNGYRVADLEHSDPARTLTGTTPEACPAHLRAAPDTASGAPDGARVAISLRQAPTAVRVTGVSVTSGPGDNGTWDAGETVEAEVRFGAAVTVTGGPPTLGILLDGTRRAAAYEDGSGTDTLAFTWTVTDADDGARRARVVSNGLSLEGATLTADGNAAVETGFRVAPFVTAVALAPDASGDRRWTPGEALEARLTFSEAVTVDGGTPALGVSAGGEAATLAYASGSGSAVLVFSRAVTESDGSLSQVAVTADSLALGGATIVSAASGLAAELGHDGTGPTAAPQAVEPEPLTASFTAVPDSHGGNPFTLELTFSESPAMSYRALHRVDGQEGMLWVRYGTVSEVRRIEQGSNAGWRITIEPEGAQDVVVRLPATPDCDVAGAICTPDGRGLAADVTATVPAAVSADTPFRVRLKDVPGEHDGSGEIAFEVVFNKAPADYSYATLRDATLRIARDGTALAPKVRRLLEGADRNRQWAVTVAPGGNADVTVSVGPFSACSEAGAVCTSDDEVLANAVTATIQGPPGLSAADARAYEAAGATVDFAVTLGRASQHTVTVDYATSDGTAEAGSDYEAASGTLTFAPGETARTVAVAVLNDAHDEGEETFTLTLSNPHGGNAWLEDATATGTIENTDAMPRAWLARFARTVAEQVIAAAEGRFAAARRPGVEVTLAGQPIGLSGSAPENPDARAAGEAEARSRLAAANWLQGTEDADAGDRRAGHDSRSVTPREILTGSSFALTGEAKAGGLVSLWGRGAVSRFDGREGELTLSGEVTSVMLGADWARGPGGVAPSGAGSWTAGLLVSRSAGEGSYRGEGEGQVSSTLTALWPYGRYEASDRVTLWGVAGYGAGDLVLTPAGQSAMRAGMDLMMGAVGLRGVALEAPAEGGVELAVTSDAMGVRTSSEKAAGAAAVTRLRLGLEGTWRGLAAGGGALAPRVEVGVRHDGGDAETGFGLDLGGGLVWSHPAAGLTAELSGRGLLTHESKGFRDRGLSVSFAWDPGQGSGRGPKLTVTQTVGGSASGGADALLGQRHLERLAANDDGTGADDLANRRLDLHMGYGFSAFGDRFTSTPELGLGLSNGHREYALGWRLNRRGGPGALELLVEGTRREAANHDAAPEHGVGLRVTARW